MGAFDHPFSTTHRWDTTRKPTPTRTISRPRMSNGCLERRWFEPKWPGQCYMWQSHSGHSNPSEVRLRPHNFCSKKQKKRPTAKTYWARFSSGRLVPDLPHPTLRPLPQNPPPRLPNPKISSFFVLLRMCALFFLERFGRGIATPCPPLSLSSSPRPPTPDRPQMMATRKNSLESALKCFSCWTG